jgi:hypothetical protein
MRSLRRSNDGAMTTGEHEPYRTSTVRQTSALESAGRPALVGLVMLLWSKTIDLTIILVGTVADRVGWVLRIDHSLKDEWVYDNIRSATELARLLAGLFVGSALCVVATAPRASRARTLAVASAAGCFVLILFDVELFVRHLRATEISELWWYASVGVRDAVSVVAGLLIVATLRRLVRSASSLPQVTIEVIVVVLILVDPLLKWLRWLVPRFAVHLGAYGTALMYLVPLAIGCLLLWLIRKTAADVRRGSPHAASSS